MGPFYASRIHHSTCPGSPGSPLPLLLRPLPLMLSLARRRGIPQSHLLPSDPCNKTVLLAPMFSPQSNQRTVPHKKRGTPRPKVTGRICAGMLMPHPTSTDTLPASATSRRRRLGRRRVPFRFSSCLGLPLVVDTGDPKRTMMERRGQKPSRLRGSRRRPSAP